MAKWDRNTPWRQGHLLTAETVAAFGLNGDDPPENVAIVVISHDCDLAQPAEVEPEVEMIVGRFIDEAHGNFTNCKNLRCLHVACGAGETVRIVELYANRRQTLPKDSPDAKRPALVVHAPSAEILMSATERNTLQIWLAARYRRSAFPDEFDRRLKQTGVAEKLAKVFKNSGHHVSAVFFDVDRGLERTRIGPDDPYELIVTLLYSTDTDPDEAEAETTKTALAVKDIFESRCHADKGEERVWQWIEIVDVEVVSDRALSYADSLHLKKWQADHISLRADPPQGIFEG
jgi:hypothetical protein